MLRTRESLAFCANSIVLRPSPYLESPDMAKPPNDICLIHPSARMNLMTLIICDLFANVRIVPELILKPHTFAELIGHFSPNYLVCAVGILINQSQNLING